MATTKERLELIENALLVLAGGAATGPIAYDIGRRGAVATGMTAGRLALGTPVGQAALAGITYDQLVREVLRRDRAAADEVGTDNVFAEAMRQLPTPIPALPGFTARAAVGPAKKIRKKAASKYNRAVKAGMAAVKSSKFGGKKGKISNARKTFGMVNKVVSTVKSGAKKVPTKGIKGVISRAARKVLK